MKPHSRIDISGTQIETEYSEELIEMIQLGISN